MAKTLRELFIQGLRARGHTYVRQTRRFEVYSNGVLWFFIGSHGALRVAKRDASTASYPCGSAFKQDLLREDERAL